MDEASIIWLSLKVALTASLFGLPVAIGLAMLLARVNFYGKSLLNAVVHLPLLLPPVVTGFALLIAFGRKGFIGETLYDLTGFTFAFRWWGAALAAGLMSLPIVVQPMRVAFENIDHDIDEAALTLGASRWQKFWLITLPMAMPGVLAGVVLGFVKALGEFGATITFVSNIPGETQTLSLAIYSLLQTPNGDAAALRLVWVSVALSFAAVFAADYFARRFRRTRTS
ncbi:MAG TPA: molybdate ABC transporter permease subunit [Aestuariivirga sp.]